MSRLINADAIIEIFDKDKYDQIRNEYQSGYNDGLLHAEVIADNLPTVDAIPIEWMLKWEDAPLTDEYMKIGSSVKTKEIGRTVNWNTVKWMILEWRKEHEQID